MYATIHLALCIGRTVEGCADGLKATALSWARISWVDSVLSERDALEDWLIGVVVSLGMSTVDFSAASAAIMGGEDFYFGIKMQD